MANPTGHIKPSNQLRPPLKFNRAYNPKKEFSLIQKLTSNSLISNKQNKQLEQYYVRFDLCRKQLDKLNVAKVTNQEKGLIMHGNQNTVYNIINQIKLAVQNNNKAKGNASQLLQSQWLILIRLIIGLILKLLNLYQNCLYLLSLRILDLMPNNQQPYYPTTANIQRIFQPKGSNNSLSL